jgi:hypothetical protein
MPFRSGNGRTSAANHHRNVGATAKEVAERASAITRLEVELAILELKRKAVALGLGAAFAAAAAILGLIGLGFIFATIAAALATFLPTWLSLLIVTLLLFALAGILVLLALSRFRRGTPPIPKKAIHQAQLTKEAIKG